MVAMLEIKAGPEELRKRPGCLRSVRASIYGEASLVVVDTLCCGNGVGRRTIMKIAAFYGVVVQLNLDGAHAHCMRSLAHAVL
jgi:hypothetical protein